MLRTVKKTYACRHCDPAAVPAEQRLQTAGPAQVGPIPKGLCGPGLLAHVITAKFADHTPLHRLATQLARSGVAVARTTLGDWLRQAADLLEPLYLLMHRRLLLSRVIHGDDTSVKLRVEGSERTAKAHLWVGIGDADFPYVVFDFTAGYTAAGPERFFNDYKGYLQADALAQYEGLYGDGRVQHVCCWAHARRKFVAASESKDERAEVALADPQAVRRRTRAVAVAAACGRPGGDGTTSAAEEQRRAGAAATSRTDPGRVQGVAGRASHQRLAEVPAGPGHRLRAEQLGGVGRYLEQGYLAIDNNLSERTLRAVALGRNNWGVIGSETGGRTAAVLYTMIGTCKHLAIDPFAYLQEALPGLFALGDKPSAEELLEWLPDRWHTGRARAGRTNRRQTGNNQRADQADSAAR